MKHKNLFFTPEREATLLMKVIWIAVCLILMGLLLPIKHSDPNPDRVQGKLLKDVIFGISRGLLIGLTSTKIIAGWKRGAILGTILSIVYLISSWLVMRAGLIEMELNVSWGWFILIAIISDTLHGAFLGLIFGDEKFLSPKSQKLTAES